MFDPKRGLTFTLAWLLFSLAARSRLLPAAEPIPPGILNPAWKGSIPRYVPVWFAEAETAAFQGERVSDPTASGGAAVFFPTSKAYHPDTEVAWRTPSLDPGRYRARLSVRARGRSDDGLLGRIEVTDPAGGEARCPPRLIHDFHHQSSPAYFELALSFELPQPGELKLRVAHNGQTDLWVDALRLDSVIFSAPPAHKLGPPRAEGARARVSLDGSWEFQPVYGDLVYPPTDAWSRVPIRVPSAWNANSFARASEEQGAYYPSYPPAWDQAKAAWYRLRFRLEEGDPPADDAGGLRRLRLPLRGRRLVLRFDAVAHTAEVYLNGVAVGYHEGAFTPFEVDVTAAVREEEENELLVGVRTWHHYYDRKKRRTMTTGSFWGEHAGGIWQSVSLASRSPVSISDVFIRSSVRRAEITVTAEVRNDDGREHSVTLSPALIRGPTDPGPLDGPVPGFEPLSADLPASGTAALEWKKPWANPRLWSPEDPHLYTLAVSSVDAASSGRALPADTFTRTFGFREIWIDGRRICLNGRRLRLRGDAWHFMGPPQMDPAYARLWYDLARRSNLNVIRLHAQPFPEFYLDLADEMGMLIIGETSWWASSGGYLYADAFRERFARELEEFIRRDRNHPSLIMWSVANEVAAGHRFYSDDGITDQAALRSLAAEFAERIRALDPSRPLSSDGDEDLGGSTDLWSLHYPYAGVDYPSAKPVTIGEACPMYYAGPPDVDAVGGEEVYRSFRARTRAVAEIAFWQLRNYRRWAEQITPFNLVWYCLDPLPFRGGSLPDGVRSAAPGLPDRIRPFASTLNPGWEEAVPSHQPNLLFTPICEALAPRTFFLAKRGLRFYAPGNPEIPLLVFNDGPEDATFAVRFELAAAGRSVTRGAAAAVPSGEFRRIEPNIPVPAVTERSDGTLTVVLESAGRMVRSASYPVYLYPDIGRWPDLPGLSDRRIAVYADSDDLTRALDQLRIGFERLYGLSELRDVQCDLLLVGPGVPPAEAAVEKLRERLRRRLRVLFFEGNAAWVEALGLARVDPTPYEKVFPFRWDHPLVEGMAPWTLEYWMAAVPDRAREDRIERIGEGALAAWQRGNFRALLAIGGGRSVVAEGAEGHSLFFINQMNVVRRVHDEPAALHFLANLIRYAAAAPFWQPLPAAMVASATARLGPFLRAVGANAPVLDSVTDPFLAGTEGVVLVDASAPDPGGWSPRVRRFVELGGTAVLWGMTPASAPDWTRELPGEPRLLDCDAEQLVKSVTRTGEPDPILDGMHHATMYWVRDSLPAPVLEFSLGISPDPRVTPLLEVPPFDWRCWEEKPETIRTVLALQETRKPKGAPEYGLIRVRIGDGDLYLCQLPTDLNQPRAVELARQLLSNLGLPLSRERGAQEVTFNVDAEGFIRSWLLCGPFTAEATGSLLEVDFLGGEADARPAPGKPRPDEREWKTYYAPEAALDFEVPELFGWTDHAAVYAAVYIYSPEDHQAPSTDPAGGVDLLFGSDDGCAVWLNGRPLYAETASRPLVVDNIRLENLSFRRGWNLLLFKVEDQAWRWGLVARLLDRRTGRPPSGFLASPEPFPIE